MIAINNYFVITVVASQSMAKCVKVRMKIIATLTVLLSILSRLENHCIVPLHVRTTMERLMLQSPFSIQLLVAMA